MKRPSKRVLLVLIPAIIIIVIAIVWPKNATEPSSSNAISTEQPTALPSATPTWDPSGEHVIQHSGASPNGLAIEMGHSTKMFPEISVKGSCNFTKPTLQSFPVGEPQISIPDGKAIVVEDSTAYQDIMTKATSGYVVSYIVATTTYTAAYTSEQYIIVDTKDVGSTIAGLVAGSLDNHCTISPDNWTYYDSSLLDIQKKYPFPNNFSVSE